MYNVQRRFVRVLMVPECVCAGVLCCVVFLLAAHIQFETMIPAYKVRNRCAPKHSQDLIEPVQYRNQTTSESEASRHLVLHSGLEEDEHQEDKILVCIRSQVVERASDVCQNFVSLKRD